MQFANKQSLLGIDEPKEIQFTFVNACAPI